jgi:hypothetical protein
MWRLVRLEQSNEDANLRPQGIHSKVIQKQQEVLHAERSLRTAGEPRAAKL